MDRRSCPDEGTCHHSCAPTDCFRVRTCAPLSVAHYPGDDWPAEIVEQFGQPPAEPVIEDALVGRADHEGDRIAEIAERFARLQRDEVGKGMATWYSARARVARELYDALEAVLYPERRT